MDALLRDLTSGDAHRVWSACGGIARLREPAALDFLAARLEEIRAATDGVPLGGALLPNAVHLRHALRKLEFWRAREGCLCRLYPEYLFYDPGKEAETGHLRILETRLYQDGPWVDAYICECLDCHARFRVEERESHYTWWGWNPIETPFPG
jgi:hypothetical protein